MENMYREIMTVKQMSKKSVNADRHGNILYHKEFVIELLVYYKMLEYLHVAKNAQEEAKIAREHQRAKNMVKLYFANPAECTICVDFAFSRGLDYFKARGFAA